MTNISPSLDQLLRQALARHQAGQLAEAERLYRQVLAQQPLHPEALHYLGALASQVGQHDAAIELLRRSVEAKADYPEACLDLGNVYHAKGQWEAAIASFQKAISLKPDYSGAYNNWGNALQASGRQEEAIAACRKALALRPDFPEAYNNLGNAFRSMKQLDEAEAAYRRAVALRSAFSEAHFNLGNVLLMKERYDEAIASYRVALAVHPRFPKVHLHMARALQARGRSDEALAAYQQAAALDPDSFEAHRLWGDLLQAKSRFEEALTVYRRAQALQPACAGLYNELGNVLKARGHIVEAIECYREFIARQPEDPLGHNNLGATLAEIGQTPEAIACYQKALALDPHYMAAHVNLGNAWKDQGRLDEAVECFRRGLAIAPDSALVHSKLVYTLYFHPAYDAEAVCQEARQWNQRHAEPLRGQIKPHANDRRADRRLKIGYVSPDFWAQSESYFVVPLLEAHDHERFEIHCYASVVRPDAITARLQRSADAWHDVLDRSDAELAEQVRQDGIDILVDLTMHMAHNRMLLFARKPAPVQVTWLAYPGTTGVGAIDYRITDAFMDPLNADTSCYAENSIRLPDCWVCYDPLIDAAPAAARGVSGENSICFGSLNNPCKMNEPLLRLWIEVLKAVPDSRLLLLAGLAGQREAIRQMFEDAGIHPQRLEFTGYRLRPEYLRLYDHIDIGLDPLPYNGITTTCDALWMGVPVVSMRGQTAAGRAGLGMLAKVGLPELAARTPEQFIRIAGDLAADRPRLAHLRTTLRQRMHNSPLMDAPRFARNLEAAYRVMWQRWCGHAMAEMS